MNVKELIMKTKTKGDYVRSYNKTMHGCPISGSTMQVDVYKCPECGTEMEKEICSACSERRLKKELYELFEKTPPTYLPKILEGIKIKDDIEYFSKIYIKDNKIHISNEDRDTYIKLSQILFEEYDFFYKDCPIVGTNLTFQNLIDTYNESKKEKIK